MLQCQDCKSIIVTPNITLKAHNTIKCPHCKAIYIVAVCQIQEHQIEKSKLEELIYYNTPEGKK